MNAIAPATRLEATLSRPEPLVTIENLQVRFGSVVAIENLDFTVRRGEFVSLLGPSGCGKSTLLRVIARLVPVSGRIFRNCPGKARSISTRNSQAGWRFAASRES